jgi:NAD-dependent DNA ligase
MELFADIRESDLKKVRGLKTIASAIVEFLARADIQTFYTQTCVERPLVPCPVTFCTKGHEPTNQLTAVTKISNLSFLITGTLSISRSEMQAIIVENGGIVKETFTKSLDYVIVGTDPGGKLEKAQKAGVKIITENQFCGLLQ